MNRCACPASSLTSLEFAHGVVMQRCMSHEQQSWTVDGRLADARTVRSLLKDLFVEARGQRRSTVGARPRRVGHLNAPARDRTTSGAPAAGVDVDAGADEQLTALLRARGLQGSWAVA